MKNPKLQYAVEQLFYWQKNRQATNFHSILYCMFQKADTINKRKLTRGFPEEAEAFRLWNLSGNYGNDLFKEFGLI